MRARLCSLVTLALVLGGCGHDDQTGAPGAPLAQRYVAIEVTSGGEPRPLVPGTALGVGFDGDRLTAELGCGQLSARWSFERTRLVLADVEQPDADCDPARLEQTRSLTDFLTSRPQMLVSGDEAVINDGYTTIVLRDAEVPPPDEPLLRTTWQLEGGEALLVLELDGTISGEAPCGPLADAPDLRYELDGDRLHVTGAGAGPACPDTEEAQRYRRLLADEMTWLVDADRLTLTGADSEVSTFRAAVG